MEGDPYGNRPDMSPQPHRASTATVSLFRKVSGIQLNGLLELISGANRLLLSVVLSLWLLNWLSKAWERIGCAKQFYADWGVGLQDLAIAGRNSGATTIRRFVRSK